MRVLDRNIYSLRVAGASLLKLLMHAPENVRSLTTNYKRPSPFPPPIPVPDQIVRDRFTKKKKEEN